MRISSALVLSVSMAGSANAFQMRVAAGGAIRNRQLYSAEARWEEVEGRTSDLGFDTGALPAQYLSTAGPLAPIAPPTSAAESYLADYQRGESRWQEVEQRAFLVDEGDCGAPPADYYTSSSPLVPVAVEAPYRQRYNVGYENRWTEVHQRMSSCDEGDTGAALGSYEASFTPELPIAKELVANRTYVPPFLVGPYESRWSQVKARMSLCDQGDTGARPAQYGVTTTPPLNPHRDGKAFAPAVGFLTGDP